MRGTYGQLTEVPSDVKAAGATLLKELADTSQIKAVYIDFDRKGRGSCLNYDIYGYTADGLIVYQARQAFCDRANGYIQTHKTYALAGRNESGSAFWHPISSAIVHAAIRENADPGHVVIKAMAWIFEIKIDVLPVIVRQGDVALVPARPRGTALDTNEATLADTHILSAAELRQDGDRLYARNPVMRHSRNQHADVAADGWYRIAVGRSVRAWDFSPRSID
jgi:hypothetical protein